MSNSVFLFPFQSIVFPGTVSANKVLVGDGTAILPSISFILDTDTGFWRPNSNVLNIAIGGISTIGFPGSGIQLLSNMNLGWATGVDGGTASDVILSRDGAPAILALKNGTNAQLFRSYTPGLAATSNAAGMAVLNNTAALVGTPVQMSGRFTLQGTGWDTDDNVSRNVTFFTEVLPTSGATVAGSWKLGYIDPITSAIIYPMNIDSLGNFSVLNAIGAGSSVSAATLIQLGSASPIIWGSNGRLWSRANAQFQFENAAATAGVGFDVATDAVLKIRNRAENAYAMIDCLGIQSSGAAAVNFGPAHPASITVVNGIITAIS